MTKTIIFFSAAVAMSLLACGDDSKAPDAPRSVDAPNVDASFPAAPILGTQIDRMGRPAVNTALNNVFTPGNCSVTTSKACYASATCPGGETCQFTVKTMKKDAYNADQGVSSWPSTYPATFAGNLAIFDALDKGALPHTTGNAAATSTCAKAGTSCSKDSDCTAMAGDYCKVWKCHISTATTCGRDSDCPTATGEFCAGNACGNQGLYNGMLADQRGVPGVCYSGSPSTYQSGTCSYNTAATILSDDELYLDTTKTRSEGYLAVELVAASNGTFQSSDCGGRSPDNDVIDTTYSFVAGGLDAFNLTTDPPTPLVSDGVGTGSGGSFGLTNPHGDITTTFPFFGAPH